MSQHFSPHEFQEYLRQLKKNPRPSGSFYDQYIDWSRMATLTQGQRVSKAEVPYHAEKFVKGSGAAVRKGFDHTIMKD
jgi:hypothetical protein